MNIKINNSIKNFIWRNYFLIFFISFIFLSSTKVEAANLIFSPSLGNYYVGDTFKVSVVVDSQVVSINSVDTIINFPKDYLDVVSVDKVGSIFSIWIAEPTYSNADGTISFTGGLPTPGFTGSNGKIMNITFKAKVSGVAIINYSSSAVRANDGLGTDVLQSTGEGEYTIVVKPTEPVVEEPVVPTPGVSLAPVISSPTHPYSNTWYNNRNPQFTWTYPNEFNGIRISYDENPDGLPTIFYATTTSNMEFDNARDGIYYLHLQVREASGWSKISSYKFQVDTERPLNFTITELNKFDTTKTQAEFTFNAADELSGLDHFEISIDDATTTIINDVVNQYYKTVVLDSGRHAIFIKAYDKAGNYVLGSDVFYTNISQIISTSTAKIISDISDSVKKGLNTVVVVTTKTVKVVNEAVNSPVGSAITKTISTAGVVTGASMSALAISMPASLSDLWMILARLVGLLLGIIGLRRKNRPWGTVYDSITKRPLDPAYVSLIDLETGKEISSAITDLDGRYGFLVVPGRYGIETKKTNYSSPSMKMKGKTFDEVYNDLYFGGEIKIEKEGEIITKNIPMDPMSFDWNEFTKHKMNINTFIKDKDIVRAKISKIFFIIGAIVSAISLIFAPVPYNFIIAGLYVVSYLFNYVILNKQKPGILTEKYNSIPLSYALVKIFREGEDTPFVKKIADKFGKYYILVPNGTYYLTIDKKNDDETYSEIIHTADVDIKNGIINFDIKI